MPRDLSRTRKPDTDLLVESEEHIIIRQYSSTIPPASELQGLQTIDPAFPERVMRIVEKHADADIRKKDRFSISPIIGQIATFLICCMGFGIGVLFAFKGIEAGAITAVISGIAPIVIAALSNLKKK